MDPAKRAARREFKGAMRQRIKEIAPSLDLSDKQLKRALTLEMFELAKLIEKYDVNAWWLFEGHGPIFGQSSPRAARLAQASNLQVRKRGRPS